MVIRSFLRWRDRFGTSWFLILERPYSLKKHSLRLLGPVSGPHSCGSIRFFSRPAFFFPLCTFLLSIDPAVLFSRTVGPARTNCFHPKVFKKSRGSLSVLSNFFTGAFLLPSIHPRIRICSLRRVSFLVFPPAHRLRGTFFFTLVPDLYAEAT